MERISALGLDVGKRRIGVAGCDGLGLIATGLDTIQRRSFIQDLEQFQAIVQERQVQLLVVGLPYSKEGTIGFQATHIQKYAQRLGEALQLPVEYIDEQFTSYEAKEQMKAQKLSPRYNKGLVDRKAAAIILQQWLDRRRELRPCT